MLDELGEGTEPGEGAAIAQAVLEALVERGATVIATTHFNRLKEMAGSDEHFVNASAEFDPDTLRPTYRIQMGAPGSSGATWVAERMGLPAPLLERAHQLLAHEDRKLQARPAGFAESACAPSRRAARPTGRPPTAPTGASSRASSAPPPSRSSTQRRPLPARSSTGSRCRPARASSWRASPVRPRCSSRPTGAVGWSCAWAMRARSFPRAACCAC